MMLKIQSSTGYVFPIGTAICSTWRKYLVSTCSNTSTCTTGEQLEHVEIPVAKMDQTDHAETSLDLLNILDQSSAAFTDSEVLNSQQSTTTASTCTDVQWSQGSCFILDKLELLNKFLETTNQSPIKEKRKYLSEVGKATQISCVQKVMRCLSAVCHTMYPEDGEKLQDLVMEHITGSLKAQKQIASPDESIILKEIYMQAESWTLKRQILSIITETKSFSEANKMIPNLTQWRYYAAKRHSDDIGCGLPVPQVKIHRNKIDESQLEHFIDFITSSSVIKDLPFGTKTMKLSTGEVVTVPNLIRSLAPTSLIKQYISHCEFEGVEPLEGGRAFVDLEEILTNLKLPDEGEKVLKKKLIAGKQYLKTDYKSVCLSIQYISELDQQISSFFSRLSMKDKKDVRSAEEEDRLSRLKKEILDDICDD